MMDIRTFGIFAHVDAGKTTLTEGILHICGAINNQGRVDDGTAHTDRLDVEKQRGISVQACPVVFKHKNVKYHLIDTPGHLDFTHEVETALQIIDGAIIMISAVEGVQPHTQIILDEIKKYDIPAMLFINKVDRVGASVEKTINSIKKCFSKDIILMQKTQGQQTTDIKLADNFNSEDTIDYALDILSNHDDDLMEKFLEGNKIDREEIIRYIYKNSKSANVYPVFTGSALHGVGIKPLVNEIENCLPGPKGSPDNSVSANVFKVQNSDFGRMAFVRVYDGKLKVKKEVKTTFSKKILKANQIKMFDGRKFTDVNELLPGEIGAVLGFDSVKPKDSIGKSSKLYRKALTTGIPVMSVKVYPEDPGKYNELLNALQTLNDEDPQLNLIWIPDKKEFNIDIYGPIQMEILETLMINRFGLEVEFDSPSVIYKETPAKEGIGFESYTMPKPCWAVMKLLIKPGKPGSGVNFKSEVPHKKILKRYQKQLEDALPMALSQGLYGWQVTDIDITLIDGEHHPLHTKSPDFTVATPMAIMDGLKNTGTYLLEPVLKFDIKGPEDCLGKTIKKLTDMRCVFDSPIISKGQFNIVGEMPVATSLNFSVEFGILTHGKGIVKTKFLKYQKCPVELGDTRERRGVNPLDRSKYILSVRHAL